MDKKAIKKVEKKLDEYHKASMKLYYLKNRFEKLKAEIYSARKKKAELEQEYWKLIK